MKQFFVYIMASAKRTLYVGVTSNLSARVWQHKAKIVEGFTKQYNVTRLVYYETADDPWTAIAREKQIKGLARLKKMALIESMNPEWNDLSLEWEGPRDSSSGLRPSSE